MEPKKQKILNSIASFIIIAILLAFSFYFYSKLRENNLLEAQKSFESTTNQSAIIIKNRIKRYVYVLHGARAFFESSESVEKDEFLKYFETLDAKSNYPGLNNFTYIERVKAEEKNAYEEKTGIKIYPAEEDSEYWAVKYIKSEESPFLLGYDLRSEDSAQLFFENVRDNGKPTITSPFKLLPNEKISVNIIMPLYQKNSPIETVEERRLAFRGFLSATLKTEDFFQALSGEYKENWDDIGINIVDLNEENFILEEKDRQVLQFIPETLKNKIAENKDGEIIKYNLSMDIQGRLWIVEFSSKKDYGLSKFDILLPRVVFFAITILNFLIIILLYLLTNSKKRAEKMAEKKTFDIEQKEKRINDLLENAPDPIAILDLRGAITFVNNSVEDVSGYTKEELIGKNFVEIGLVSLPTLPRALEEFSYLSQGISRPPYQIEIVKKDGSKFPVEIGHKPIFENDKVIGIQLILRDITIRNKFEEELKKKNTEAERLNNMLLNRETKMIALKKEINELKERLNIK